MDQKITAELRVIGCAIKPFAYGEDVGEVVVVKAEGEWLSEFPPHPKYPVSLHITVYPGCGAIPVTGDKIRITVEQV